MLHLFLTANRAELIHRCKAKVALEPFSQSGKNRSGLGLGLAICKRSVEANNGLLSVRDVPGVGCVFTIDLPSHGLAQIA